MDAIDTLKANTMNSPVEEVEMEFPIRVERYELRDAKPAPGRWRGGFGPVRENRFLVEAIASCEGDRCLDPPRGIHGGKDALPGKITRVHADGGETVLPSKFSGQKFEAGDVLRLEGPMGGGYGDPFERDPGAVAADVRAGYVTFEEARADYGVVLAADGRSVDEGATHVARGRG